MDEDIFEAEPGIDEAIAAFTKARPKFVKEDGEGLSEDEDVEADDEDEEDLEDTEESDEDPADTDDEDESDEDESDDDEPAPKAKSKALADDEAEVEFTVDGKAQRVSIKDLKRLAGQEASLTQKAQALADQRRAVEAQGLYMSNILQKRYEAAKANAAKYSTVDLFKASRDLEPDEFDALREAKEAAEGELKFIESEAHEFMVRARNHQATLRKEQAREALKVITKEIPEWSDDLYGKIRTNAISLGMDPQTVNEITDPGAIKVMHMALKYLETQKTAETKVTQKVKTAPKKVVKKSENASDNKTSKLKVKRQTARETGDIDDVTELFLASMRDAD